MLNKLTDDLIELALREDLGDGDHTSLACIPVGAVGQARLLVKDEGIIAGIEIAQQVFRRLDTETEFHPLLHDGDAVKYGDVAFTVKGRVRSLLQAERLVLNIMQHMSGIASQTRIYADKLTGLPCQVLDTRKTTPGMRMLDKLAVKIGGGANHRVGLFDMILIKDNHIDYAGGIEEALRRTFDYLAGTGKNLKIEIEARSLEDVRRIMAFEKKVDRIMLDNFSPEETAIAVKVIAGFCETESSGGITLENLREYAECGVDYISVGALTHHIRSLDLSLKAIDY